MNERLEREWKSYCKKQGAGTMVSVNVKDVANHFYNLALKDVKKEVEMRRRLPGGWDSEGEPQYWEELGMDAGYKHILDFIDKLSE